MTTSDGSEIKLLSSLNKYFKLNKNKYFKLHKNYYYTTATINCIYDVDNNFPLFLNIKKSFNEVYNLIEKLKDNVIIAIKQNFVLWLYNQK